MNFLCAGRTGAVYTPEARRLAREKFGAQEGVGDGLVRQSYAFPTLTANFQKVSLASLEASRDLFFATARQHPEKTFLLTKVGCGIAGFNEAEIRSLFKNAPANVVLPEDWRKTAPSRSRLGY